MRNLKPLNARERKHVLAILERQFGFSHAFPYLLFINTKRRIYIINREIDRLELDQLRVDTYGLYFGELFDDAIRLSVEGSQIVGKHATRHIVDLDRSQFEAWMKRFNIPLSKDPGEGFLLVRHNTDFVGCGKFVQGSLHNYLPKSRALSTVNA